jgi:hypothetical protein
MQASHKLVELLKKKPVSKPILKLGINLSDRPEMSQTSKTIAMEVKLSDKSDPENTKRELAFKERIRQMNLNNLRAIKIKPKTKEHSALISPIQSFSKSENRIPNIMQPKPPPKRALTLTQQKMRAIREKRLRMKKKREEKTVAKLLQSRKLIDSRQQELDKTALKTRKADFKFKIDPYYLNNRETFINFIDQKLYNIKEKRGIDKEIKSCDDLNANKQTGSFSLLLHQEIVKEYLNIYSPYRGLFLYFGLGAGKTCASIAIAEGVKDYNKIVVMTPASLEKNYMTELKFCGDDVFRKNHYWEFVQNIPSNATQIEELTRILNLPVNVIRKNNGIWAINMSPPSAKGNYGKLTAPQQKSLNIQIDAMIQNKYHFIHYNGLRNIDKYEAEGLKNGGNYFNNKVVIIDEVHNFVGTISNQLGNKNSFNIKLYNYLMDAENCKIIFLTGTPIINYPNEIGIFFNMLRGRIKTYEFTLNTTKESRIKRLDVKYLRKILYSKNDEIDYLEYNNNKLTITRNPFRFITRYKKIKDNDGTPILLNNSIIRKSDTEFDVFRNEGSYETSFLSKIVETLEEKGIRLSMAKEKNCEKIESSDSIYNKVCIKKYKCFPDDYDTFTAKFIDPNTQEIINKNVFKRRIIGLTSYFKAAVDALLPTFNKDSDIIEEYIPMSVYQLSAYNKIRNIEIDKEHTAGIKLVTTNDIYKNSSASYKIYSRECCNFAFPEGIKRPRPKVKKKNLEEEKKGTKSTEGKSKDVENDTFTKEALLNAAMIDTDEVVANIEDDRLSSQGDAETADIEEFEDKSYKVRLKEAIEEIDLAKNELLVGENLDKHSPKFKRILEKINSQVVNTDKTTIDGTHLVYSFFNNVEGLGIFKMVLEANGYKRFKIGNDGGVWKIDMNKEDLQKPCYILYSGNEKTDEKEYLRLIFNSEWDKLPETLHKQLLSIKNRYSQVAEDETTVLNNFHGEIIKVFMITSAGAEGITLKNVRAVHLMEPYWHPVRFEQVIGRAVRICSHEHLPEEEQKVVVYIYLMKFLQQHLKANPEAKDEGSKKPLVSTLIMKNDRSKDKKRVITSDEKLYEISNIKKKINASILHAIKETSIDCKVHKKNGDNLQCFSINSPNLQEYTFNPNHMKDAPSQQEEVELTLYPITDKKDPNIKYYLKKYDENSSEMKGVLYNFNAYKNNKTLIEVGETGH